ncbi:heterokaryon incompatibility protein-domain-containing protein [Hypoxylon crocopeplum]|nr:heterokaryon incompatibility protein-domain-containing protein [Hypoxylon crocopeplum]
MNLSITPYSASKGLDEPPTIGSYSQCNVCFNLSQAVVDELKLPEDGDYSPRRYHNIFDIRRTPKGYHISRITFYLIEESKSSGCPFCRFLNAVIVKFVSSPSPHDRISLFLEEGHIRFTIHLSGSVVHRFDVYQLTSSASEQSRSPYGHLPVLPDIKPPHSEESFNYLKSRLRACVETHDSCRQNLSSASKRLLHLGSTGDSSASLYETPVGFREPYVALSYCWGGDVPLKTLKSNIRSLMQGFSLTQLPAAVRDAAQITRKLGLQYLWVDSLCIMQDSKTDWEEQSAKMCSIYEQAYLTIVASSAGSADVSFVNHLWRPPKFHYRIANEHDITLVAREGCTNGHHYNPYTSNCPPPDPLITRGWTLQESVLSTRMISYSTCELQWQCKSTRTCECQMPPDKWQVPVIQAGLSQLEILSTWDQIVSTYTQRHLTYPGDKLPAMSGICQLMQRQTGWRYLAGLWEDHHIRRHIRALRRGRSA